MELGYHLSAEEHGPRALVRNAARAEEIGFRFATISDHFHPWLDQQGQSPFVWTVLGSLAEATGEMRFLTAVTCPTIRTHPAIVAHAAATTAAAMPGRFALGVGTGENLNEHVVATRWPAPRERLEMLGEAIEVIRELFSGELVSHRSRHYCVEDARLYTLPEDPPEIHMAASGPVAATRAGELTDGLIIDAPDDEVISRFRRNDDARPITAKLMVCWSGDADDARRTALEWWPVGGVGAAGADLRLPSDFASVADNITEGAALSAMIVTNEIDPIVAGVEALAAAGATRVVLHQVGPDQSGFLDTVGAELAAHYA